MNTSKIYEAINSKQKQLKMKRNWSLIWTLYLVSKRYIYIIKAMKIAPVHLQEMN